MNKKSIPSPYMARMTKEMFEEDMPSLATAFIDTPLESTITTKKFKQTLHSMVHQELAYRREAGKVSKAPVLVMVIEKGSVMGDLDQVRTALATYSPKTNMLRVFRGQAVFWK